MKRNLIITFVFVLLLLVLSACASVSNAMDIPTNAPATPAQATLAPATLREAQVQSVEIRFSKIEPVQVWAIVRGNLSELCADIN